MSNSFYTAELVTCHVVIGVAPTPNLGSSRDERESAVQRDLLILLKHEFADPAYLGELFYCEHCVLMEGILAAFPDLAERIDVLRVDWPRPRREVVELIGAENQSLPVLIFADDADASLSTGSFGGRRFASDKRSILEALAQRHGIPLPHP